MLPKDHMLFTAEENELFTFNYFLVIIRFFLYNLYFHIYFFPL